MMKAIPRNRAQEERMAEGMGIWQRKNWTACIHDKAAREKIF